MLRKIILLVISNGKLMLKKVFYKTRLKYSYLSFIRMSTKISIEGKTAFISIGKMVDLKENNEIKAKNGKVIIQDNCFINRNCVLVSMEEICIGEKTIIGPGVMIYDHDHKPENKEEYHTSAVRIGKNCWVGAGAIILKGVTIGDNAVVAAGTIVTKNIPPNTLVRTELNYIKSEI